MEDLTTGSLSRHLMKTASFMLVTMVFQTLYFLVDLYWVGRLGKEAVAAVAIAGNLMFVVLAVTQMLGVGTTTLVSHAVGRRDRETARHVFNQSQVLSIGVGLVFFAVVMALRGVYARALAADATTAALARDYLTWFIPAMSMQFALVAMAAALRGTGNFKPGMVVQTTTVIINIVLAPVLMFGWGSGRPMGVAGAAAASLVAVAVGVGWLSTYFFSDTEFLRFEAGGRTPDLGVWKRLLGIGLPAGAEFGLMAVYLFIVYVISRPFGAAAQAGFGIGLRIVQALFMPVVALGFAVAPVAGQNFGAGKGTRVRQTFRDGALMASAVMIVCAVVCNWIPGRLIARLLPGPAGGRGRLRVPPHHGAELRRLRAHLRRLEHVPGDGQHHSRAGHLRAPHRPRRDSGVHPLAIAGLRAALDLVPVGGDDRGADDREPPAAEAGVPAAPGK